MNDNFLEDFKRFFLGASTPSGFVSYFDQIGEYRKDWQRYLIKGGPGTGKSSLMKKIAYELSDFAGDMELIYCSADPNSLDGIIFNDLKVSIVDATAPHVLEPQYPGTFENTVSICDCWDAEKLKENRESIIDLFDKNKFYQTQAVNMLKSAGALLKSNFDIVSQYVNSKKAKDYIYNLLDEELSDVTTNGKSEGSEEKRFISATSVGEIQFYEDTAYLLADKIYAIEDPYGTVAEIMLSGVRDVFLDKGIDIITCYCSMFSGEKIDHIFIPSLGLGFVTSNDYHSFDRDIYKIINSKNFIYTINNDFKEQIKFNKNTASKIIDKSSEMMYDAKIIHDKIESYYSEAMDFNLVNQKANNIISIIKKRI